MDPSGTPQVDPSGTWGQGGVGPGLAHLPGNNAQTIACATQWQRAQKSCALLHLAYI